jgi:hypothetical protein
MQNKNLGIAITIAAVLLCGLPGILSLCAGSLVAINVLFLEGPKSDSSIGLGLLCASAFLIVVPIVAGILTLRKRTPPKVAIPDDEPIPPPS